MSQEAPPSAHAPIYDGRPWWKQLNRYHWYVFALCSMGWLFDTMDQKIFTASRAYAMKEFMPGASGDDMRTYGGLVTGIFILGWASGGLIFGVIGDKWGRAKTMALTIFVYAFFTGFSAFAQNWWQFGIFRFLTGLGVGGEFAAGAALLAEVMPNSARTKALGMLQALSAVGNVMGAWLFGYGAGLYLYFAGKIGHGDAKFGWRQLYLVGVAPALLAVLVRFGMKEPERWTKAKSDAEKARAQGQEVKMGGIREVFAHPRWRRNAICGMCIAIAGVIGLWSIGFYMPELIGSMIPDVDDATTPKIAAIIDEPELKSQTALVEKLSAGEKQQWSALAAGIQTPEADKNGALSAALSESSRHELKLALNKKKLISDGEILYQFGAFAGMFIFAYAATRFGRRKAFLFAFILAWASVVYVMTQFHKPSNIYYMWPIQGFCMLLPFGGYAIYFPELFPTRLRTTGTGLCYNVGRYVSATGPILLTLLGSALAGKTEMHQFRVAALIVSSCYLIGMAALIWAPETAGQPLPEEERGFAH
ncbi:MAG TPA: MFS transporter [Planctomycetota bacterium]|nr:MFS transporter [Planctomycetota bacterium]